MNLKEIFKIRKKNAETDEVIITIGNHLATEQVFKSEKEAQKVIDATDCIVTGKQNKKSNNKKRGEINYDSYKNFREKYTRRQQ